MSVQLSCTLTPEGPCLWCKESRRPPNVPADAERTYKDGGARKTGGLQTCLSSQAVPTRTAGGRGGATGSAPLPDPARPRKNSSCRSTRRCAWRGSFGFVNQKEWRLWCRSCARPANMPACPDEVCVHDGWWGWEHFLYHANLDAARLRRRRHAPPASARRQDVRARRARAGASSGGDEPVPPSVGGVASVLSCAALPHLHLQYRASCFPFGSKVFLKGCSIFESCQAGACARA